MTTLSKEDVVQMARSGKIYDWFWLTEGSEEFDSELYALTEFATLARADIVEANKALVAENGRLKKQLRQQAEAIASTINKHHTALAAAEAREEKFIAALDQAESALGEIRDFPLTYLEVSEALALPNDDSALREMIAGVYEECAKVCENSDRYRGDYFAAKIRELAKQKGLTS